MSINANRGPLPRVGDVIHVAAGTIMGYRGAFRMRVDRIDCDGRGRDAFQTFVGGVLVNADGRDRKGSPERLIIVEPRGWAGVTIITPAPPTDDEIDAAYADHARRNRSTRACDHTADVIGCVHPMCPGVPPVEGATVREYVSDVTSAMARAFRDTLAAYEHVSDVTLPEVFTTQFGNRDQRWYTVMRVVTCGRSVDLVSWETTGCRYANAIIIDGRLVSADATAGYSLHGSVGLICVAREIADIIRGLNDRDPVRRAGQLRFGDRVSGVNPNGHSFGGYVCEAPTSVKAAGGRPAVAVRLCSYPIPGRGAYATVTVDTKFSALPIDDDDAAALARCVDSLNLTADQRATVGMWCAEHGHPLADPPAGGALVDQGDPRPDGPGPADAAPEPARSDDSPETADVATESEPIMSDAVTTDAPAVAPAATDAADVAGLPTGQLSVTVDRDALLQAVTVAAWSAPSRPNVPVLAGVVLSAHAGSLYAATYDYDVWSRTGIDAEVARDGRALVDVKRLRDVLKAFPKARRPRKGETVSADAGRVTLVNNGAQLVVSCGSTRMTLDTMPVADYPTFPPIGEPVATVAADRLAASVARVAVAAGRDDTLPVLTCVNVTATADGGTAQLTTTDRYRLAVDDMPWLPFVTAGAGPRESIRPASIPAGVLSYVAKRYGKTGAGVTVLMDIAGLHPTVAFACGGTVIGTRTNDAQFPAVRKLIPDTVADRFTVDRDALVGAIQRAATVAERSAPVALRLSDSCVTVTVGSDSSPTAEESVPCTRDHTGPATVIGLNPAYAVDALRVLPSGPVVIGHNAPNKPITVTSADVPTYTHMLMTVRLSAGETQPAAPASTAAPRSAVAASDQGPASAPVAEPADQDPTPEPAPVPDAASVTPEPAPAPAVPVSPAVPVVPSDPGGQLHGVSRARVAEILATRTWSSAVIRVGTGRARSVHGVQVLRLNAGRLEYGTEYAAVRDVLSTLGGAWNKTEKGFVFEPSKVVWGGGYTPEPSVKVDEWVARHRATGAGSADAVPTPVGSGTDTAAAADSAERGGGSTVVGTASDGSPVMVAHVTRVDAVADQDGAGPVGDVAGPGIVRQATALPDGAHVTVNGCNGHGEPLQLDGYVSGTPVYSGHRGVRIMLSAATGGKSRPVYVRSDKPGHAVSVTPVGDVDQGDGAADAEHTPAETSAGVCEPAERAAQRAYESMRAGDYAGARAALSDVSAVAPAGYLVAGRFTVEGVSSLIDQAERDAAPAPVVATADDAAPAVDATPEPAPAVAVAAPVVSVKKWWLRAHGLLQDADGPADAPAAPDPVNADADADAGTVTLVYTLAKYAAGVNDGRSYRASRSMIRTALAAAGVRGSVRTGDTDRRAVSVQCAADDRDRVAAVVADAVTAELSS